MKKLLLVVDVQNAFINEVSNWLPEKLAAFIRASNYDKVAATRYINHEDSSCYKYMSWTDCVTEESQAICDELSGLYDCAFDKDTYSSVTDEVMNFLMKENFDEIHICGISESCCVLATAYALFDAGFNIKVIPALCAVTDPTQGYKDMVDLVLRENVPCMNIEET